MIATNETATHPDSKVTDVMKTFAGHSVKANDPALLTHFSISVGPDHFVFHSETDAYQAWGTAHRSNIPEAIIHRPERE